MSAQQYIIDAATRHQVFLQRYAGGESKKALVMLSRLRHEITARLMAEPTQFQVQRLSLVLEDIDQLYAAMSKTLRETVKQSTDALVVQEAKHSAKLYGKVTNVDWVLPAEAVLINAVDNSMMSVGRSGVNINTAIRMMSANHASTVRQTIMDGVTLGDTTADIAKSVNSIVNTVHRRDVNTVVRTAINHTSSMARSSMYEANSDILQGYEWVSTLDSKTSLICGGRDGIIYTNPTDPRPPAHFNACLEDVLITTKAGLIPIQNVKVGDYVITHTGDWMRVNAVMAKPEKSPAFTLVDSLGNRVRLTGDHPVLTAVGYKSASDIKVGDKLFNYGHKFVWPKNWGGCSFVKQGVLTNAHNMKTNVVERLVAYSITSRTAGVSSSVKLDNGITDNKVSYVVTDNLLKLKINIKRLKEFFKHLLVKCRFISEASG